MPKRLTCWLLCEDIEQERLFRPILERQFRRIYVERKGGASFVLQRLEPLASKIRQHHQEAVALLVVIDGDKSGLRRRLEEIRTAAGFTGAVWEERIAKCIPCRNVETWILWLCGSRDIDEQTDYKQVFRRSAGQGGISARKAAEAWFAPLTPEERQNEQNRLPALAEGRKEVERLARFARL